MKEFTIKIIIFSIFLILYFGLNGVINFFIYSNEKPELRDSNILIIGDSHPQKSLNPKLFHGAQNITQSAEPIILSYWKLKYLLSQVKIDTLIIGIGHHNISAYNDLKFINEQWSFEMFKRSYTIENFKSIEREVEVDYAAFYKILWKEIGFYPKRNHFHFIGNFKNSLKSDVSDSSNTIRRHYYNDDKEIGFSETSISHLDSIIRLCESMRIKPIIINSPVHKSYFHKIPSRFKQKFKEIEHQLRSKGVTIIDKSAAQYPDSLFLNSTHLNKNGADRFTREIKKLLGTKAKH